MVTIDFVQETGKASFLLRELKEFVPQLNWQLVEPSMVT